LKNESSKHLKSKAPVVAQQMIEKLSLSFNIYDFNLQKLQIKKPMHHKNTQHFGRIGMPCTAITIIAFSLSESERQLNAP
jgi:hypothetical protein